MAKRTHSYRDYKQDQDPLDQQQQQQQQHQHQQNQYPSTDPQPSLTLGLDYLSTGVMQAFPAPTGTGTLAYDPDTCMQDVFPQPDYGRTAESYGPYKSSLSNYTNTTSFFDVGTPGPTTDGGYSSYEIVNRRYSENSNRTSGQGTDSPSYSTPGDPEQWIPGAEFAVDREAMLEEDAMSSMPHNQERVLVDLCSPEPRTFPNPYEFVNDPEAVNYEEAMVNYQTSTSRPATVQNSFDDPWNSVEQRVPAYPIGFVAFAPSPGPNAEFYAEFASASVPPSPETSKSSPKPEERSRSGRTYSAKGKEKDRFPGWEHIVIARGSLHRVTEIPEEEVRKKGGVRTGKLPPKTKEKARRIRKVGACWSCWMQKVPCSEGDICDRCMSQIRKQSSPTTHQLCWRSGFKEYEPTFFPNFMHSHLRKNEIEDLISEHTSGFLDTVILVEVSTGSVFRPMKLHANFFEAKTGELLQQSSLTPAEPDQALQLVQRFSAPVGILGLSLSDMKKKCHKHIEEMIKNPQYVEQATAGDMSQLPKQILDIVCEYSAAKKDVPLLRNALKLHAIHYFMGNLITFSDKSTREIYNNVWPCSTPQSYLSSRLLNRQIKYAMHKLHREITALVLDGLERSLRTRTKDSWGLSFCTILVLCLCMEDLQTAADLMVVCDMQEKGEAASHTRDESSIACEELDEYPFRQCKKLFHDIYRSQKDGNAGGRGEKAFNPLKMVAENVKTGFDSTTERMVRKIHGVICNSWTEIMDRSDRPATFNMGYPVDPNDIKANSTGRLTAKFMKSFFFKDD